MLGPCDGPRAGAVRAAVERMVVHRIALIIAPPPFSRTGAWPRRGQILRSRPASRQRGAALFGGPGSATRPERAPVLGDALEERAPEGRVAELRRIGQHEPSRSIERSVGAGAIF